ncbi:MAG: site-2 protease family protein [Planctomycetota bacterium]|nr:site-2 protease family protein [Planctomycetota bacterium]
MEFLSAAFNILLFIIGFGLLIFVHELGHFIAAKWAGIRTEAFAIGFGPPIISWRKGIGFRAGSTNQPIMAQTGRNPRELSDEDMAREGLGETEYSIRWLPLGGFVRMLGQDDLAPGARASGDRSFNNTAIWKRMIVVSAGVFMNLLFAAVLFVIAFSIGVRFEAPVVGEVFPGSPASLAVGTGTATGLVGLKPDDEIVTLDGDDVPTFLDATIGVAMAAPDRTIEVGLRRTGHDGVLTFDVLPAKSESAGVLSIGITPASSTRLTGSENEETHQLVQRILERHNLWDQGLRPGMEVVEANGQDITSISQFQSIMSAGEGKPISTRWQDQDGTVEILMTPEPNWPLLRSGGGGEIDQGLFGLVPLLKISALAPDSANVGVLLPGDAIMAIGTTQGPRMKQLRDAISSNGPGEIELTVWRDGQVMPLAAQIYEQGLLKPEPKLGVVLGQAWNVLRVAQPVREVECDIDDQGSLQSVKTPVADSGILGASRIVSVDGQKVQSWRALFDVVRNRAGDQITLGVENPTPGREVRSIELDLSEVNCLGLSELGYGSALPVGLFDPVYTIRSSGGNPITAIDMGIRETVNFIVQTYLTLDRVFRGSVGVEQLQGPVGIVHLGTRIVDRGFTFLLFFLALISVNLAVVNFLPLPIVDGGLFLNLVYEKIKGRPPSPAFQNVAAIFGLLLIGTVFVMVTYNDLVRLVG